MPVLDFSKEDKLPSAKHSFWLYWAVTLPLTTAVLVGYTTFVFWIDRTQKRKLNDTPDNSNV